FDPVDVAEARWAVPDHVLVPIFVMRIEILAVEGFVHPVDEFEIVRDRHHSCLLSGWRSWLRPSGSDRRRRLLSVDCLVTPPSPGAGERLSRGEEGAKIDHPFTAPAVMPATICF